MISHTYFGLWDSNPPILAIPIIWQQQVTCLCLRFSVVLLFTISSAVSRFLFYSNEPQIT